MSHALDCRCAPGPGAMSNGYWAHTCPRDTGIWSGGGGGVEPGYHRLGRACYPTSGGRGSNSSATMQRWLGGHNPIPHGTTQSVPRLHLYFRPGLATALGHPPTTGGRGDGHQGRVNMPVGTSGCTYVFAFWGGGGLQPVLMRPTPQLSAKTWGGGYSALPC